LKVVIDGVEYAPVEEKPKTGRYVYVDGKPLLLCTAIGHGARFREDPFTSWSPDIVDADGNKIGHVYITKDGEVSISG